MHEKLYGSQKEWSDLPNPRPVFTQYAQQLGLDTSRFLADLDSMEAGARIAKDVERAERLRIPGTPTLILNGRILTADQTMVPQNLRAEIERELAKSK
jgi:protein-disulfide isomerase